MSNLRAKEAERAANMFTRQKIQQAEKHEDDLFASSSFKTEEVKEEIKAAPVIKITDAGDWGGDDDILIDDDVIDVPVDEPKSG